MNQCELKALQADEDARHTGMEQLQNWGCMLRSEGRCGPAGFKAGPIFKNATSKYADDSRSIIESYRADDAYLVMDLINWLVSEEHKMILAHLFYAESDTYSNASRTLKRYNELTKEDGIEGIGPTRLRAMLTAIEVQIGTAIIMCQSDDSWRIITKSMGANN